MCSMYLQGIVIYFTIIIVQLEPGIILLARS